MCLAFPGRIIKIEKKQATIQYPKETRTAFLSDDKFKVGDYVMVQMGIVVRKIPKKDALISQKAWSKI